MPFQPKKGIIEWKVHFSSSIESVYNALTTDEGRSRFWAEEAREDNGFIEFTILNYPTYKAKIIEAKPPELFRLEYFGTDVTFELKQTSDKGTDLSLTAVTSNEDTKQEMTAGWVSVLMAMKAAVDFGVDLRNHHSERVWEKGYLDN
ncbi:MAG: SRPBCC domain-containing protein [Chitinophagales bacterium]|nr:SRPBCC domain-containing protein [Chitinophagales bacterium]